MAVLTIRTYPDPVLKQACRPVTSVNDEVRGILRDMAETMYLNRGVGLAAPQVGVGLRLIVVDAGPERDGSELLKLVNPRITEREGGHRTEEGCLSLPGLMVELDRFDTVTVEAMDPSGNLQRIRAEGLLSVALQHEIDHLDGVLLVDRLSGLRRNLYLRKRLREGSEPAGLQTG